MSGTFLRLNRIMPDGYDIGCVNLLHKNKIAAAKERGVYQGGQKDGYRKASPERARELRKTLKLTEIASAMDVSLATVKRYLRAS